MPFVPYCITTIKEREDQTFFFCVIQELEFNLWRTMIIAESTRLFLDPGNKEMIKFSNFGHPCNKIAFPFTTRRDNQSCNVLVFSLIQNVL